MPRPPVFTQVMDVLHKRIAAGEYMLKDLPGERTIAEETGVSYMTARKAVSHLIDDQVLSRKPNGSLVLHPRMQAELAQCSVAVLIPAYPSVHLMRCRLDLAQALEQHNIQHRTVEYLHWDDSAVNQALDGPDGLVVIPMTEPIPTRILKAFTNPNSKVVIFDGDMTEQGLPSIRLYAKEHILRLFDHLWNLGHRTIDCLNAQGHSDEIARRVSHWRTWLADRGGTGELIDDPAPAHTDPIARAHRATHKLIQRRKDTLSALVCTTQPAALGAIRACNDLELAVGRDISICTINNEPTGRFFCPSLTGLEMPAIPPLMERCFDWFADTDKPWTGDLRIVPAEPVLFEGESTGPAKR